MLTKTFIPAGNLNKVLKKTSHLCVFFTSIYNLKFWVAHKSKKLQAKYCLKSKNNVKIAFALHILSNYSWSDSESESNKTLASRIRHGSALVCQSFQQLRSGLFSSRHNGTLHLSQNHTIRCLPHTFSPYLIIFES